MLWLPALACLAMPMLPARAQVCELGTGLARFDVAPRTGPDGVVDVADTIVVLRFAVGAAAPTARELRRADVMPRDPGPDGVVDVADVVRVLRAAVGIHDDHSGPPDGLGVGAEPACRREGSLMTLVGFDLVANGVAPVVLVDGAEATVRWMQEDANHDYGTQHLDTLLLELGETPPAHPQDLPPEIEVTTALGTKTITWPGQLLVNDCSEPPALELLTTVHARPSGATWLVVQGWELACTHSLHLTGRSSATQLPLEIRMLDDAREQLQHWVFTEWPEFPTEEEWDLILTTDCGTDTLPAALDSRPGAAPLPPTTRGFDREGRDDFRWTDRLGQVELLGTGLGQVDRVGWDGLDLPAEDFEASPDGSRLFVDVPPPAPFAGGSATVALRLFAGGTEATVLGGWPVEFLYRRPCAADCGSISPSVGPASGGTEVLITAPWGARLSDVTAVSFAGVAGTDLVHVNDQQIRVTSPGRSAGSAIVALERPGLDPATCETLFEYR
jgi:hypothetical protein